MKEYRFVFEGKDLPYRPVHIMTLNEALEYVKRNNLSVVKHKVVHLIGMVEVDDMYDQPIYGDVYEADDGTLYEESGRQLSNWQKEHILPLSEW